VFETNLFGPLRTIRAVLPAMRAQSRRHDRQRQPVGGRIAPFCTDLLFLPKEK
jgi:NAD(P)-dependent dehydrogenase (short-subunit alcohol dehydrogenase family)